MLSLSALGVRGPTGDFWLTGAGRCRAEQAALRPRGTSGRSGSEDSDRPACVSGAATPVRCALRGSADLFPGRASCGLFRDVLNELRFVQHVPVRRGARCSASPSLPTWPGVTVYRESSLRPPVSVLTLGRSELAISVRRRFLSFAARCLVSAVGSLVAAVGSCDSL